jgi:hypothetical protein
MHRSFEYIETPPITYANVDTIRREDEADYKEAETFPIHDYDEVRPIFKS